MGYIFLVGIIFLIGFLSLLEFFYFFAMSKQTEKWLFVEGEINTSVVEINYGLPTERGAAYTANVQYQYIVGKKKYISKRIFYGDSIGKNFSRSVKKIVNKYAQKKTVLVYYNPKYPNKSVLEIGVHSMIYRALVAGVFFLLLSVIMFIKESFFVSLMSSLQN